MVRVAAILLLFLLGSAAHARDVVTASAPDHVAVTVYRDPDRRADERMNADWPEGFAMISETRTVTLPAGASTIRFEGVAEGMAAVTAVVTGLRGGVIEKNRNADLLSPAALVDGTLGNRVTITRTNPATGKETSASAIVRTRADGGLVLQTREGFEAVRCSGLPERLDFDHVPAGLSAQPVFLIDTNDPAGGTYRVTLTYLAAGFDWQAHYVATFLDDRQRRDERNVHLLSWLTVANDNGQSFNDAELMAVAGKLNLQSDMRDLADAPEASPLHLTCYPLGNTSAGSPPPPPPPPSPMAMFAPAMDIVVTAQRRSESLMGTPVSMIAKEEALGDLKLFRVPEPVTVASKSLKQVAFLDKDRVRGALIYVQTCSPDSDQDDALPLAILFQTRNDAGHGLGSALPMGGMTVFERAPTGEQLVGETSVRDYAAGQDMEMDIGQSTQVFVQCSAQRPPDAGSDKPTTASSLSRLNATLTNATGESVKARLKLGSAAEWNVENHLKGLRVKDGEWVVETTIPGNGTRQIAWDVRPSTR